MTVNEEAREPLLVLEDVSKLYPPAPKQRVRRVLSRLRGVLMDEPFPGDVMGDDDDDDLDDDDDDLDDDDGDGQQVEPAPVRKPDGQLAIDRVSMRGYGGDSIGLVGPEGAGKTVLIKLISGAFHPTGGRIVVRGTVATALNALGSSFPAKGHTLKSALPQLGAMVGIPHERVRAHFDEMAELLDFPRFLYVPCDSMEPRRKREVILAMALSVEPDVLLIETPINDGEFGERCAQRIEELRARGTLVIAEIHNLRRGPWKPQSIVVLERGRIVRQAPVEDEVPGRKKSANRAASGDSRLQAQAEAQAKAERLVREHAEARARAEQQARAHAEAVAQARAEAERRARLEAQARSRAEAEARRREQLMKTHALEKARLEERHRRREERLREKARASVTRMEARLREGPRPKPADQQEAGLREGPRPKPADQQEAGLREAPRPKPADQQEASPDRPRAGRKADQADKSRASEAAKPRQAARGKKP